MLRVPSYDHALAQQAHIAALLHRQPLPLRVSIEEQSDQPAGVVRLISKKELQSTPSVSAVAVAGVNGRPLSLEELDETLSMTVMPVRIGDSFISDSIPGKKRKFIATCPAHSCLFPNTRYVSPHNPYVPDLILRHSIFSCPMKYELQSQR